IDTTTRADLLKWKQEYQALSDEEKIAFETKQAEDKDELIDWLHWNIAKYGEELSTAEELNTQVKEDWLDQYHISQVDPKTFNHFEGLFWYEGRLDSD